MADEAAPDQAWPPGAGEMARLIRARDWAGTPLGPPEGWPRGLRAVVELMLAMPQIASIAVGPERLLLYNDLAARQYGPRHPHALGQPIAATFADQWAPIAGFYDRVFAGESVHVPAQPVDSAGTGTPEVYDASLAPVRGGDGRVVAAFVTFVAAGDRVLAETALRESEERQAFLLKLSDALRPLGDPVGIMARASEALGRHLGVGRCGYGEVDATGEVFEVERDWTDGVMASFRGRHRLVSFGPEFTAAYRAGQAVLIEDALADARGAGAEAAFEAAGGVRASLGLPLLKDGRFVAGLFAQQVPPRRWSEQDEALAREVAERTWAAVERARAEAERRESEERYRTLFEAIDAGFCTIEVIFGEDGRATDYRIVEANAAFERQSGLAGAVGRRIRELTPDLEEHWFERYGRVALTGESMRVEGEVASLGRWFDINAFRVGVPEQRHVGLLFNDVSERRRTEAALRESERRNRFLLELGDRTRALSDAGDVTAEATRALGEHLTAAQVVYAEMDEALATATILGTWTDERALSLLGDVPLQAFGGPIIDCLRSGRTLRVDDTSGDPRTSPDLAGFEAVDVRAIVSVPLLKGGRFVAALHVHRDRAWEWTDAEVRLVEAVAERTWEAVERARAEAARAESEERLREFGEASSDLLWTRDAQSLQWEVLTPAFEAIYGLSREEALHGDDFRNWADLVLPEDRDHAVHEIERVRAGERVTFEYRVRRPKDGEVRWLRNTDFPIRGPARRVERIGGVGTDITEMKRAEEALREMQGRLQVVVAELQHRTRNLIGVVRSIANQTMAHTGPTEAFRDEFNHRLEALSRVQGLLSRAEQEPITLRALLELELDALGAAEDGRVRLDGPSVRLRPSMVQTLALAVHELATNARKHGALRDGDGRLSVRWRLQGRDGGRHARIEWREEGRAPADAAPPLPPPSPGRQGGYGRYLIERALPYTLKAQTTYELGPAGLRCTIDLPLERPSPIGST